jgi:hypothetical protein
MTATPSWSVRLNGIQSTTLVGAVNIGFGTSYGSLVAQAYEVTATPEPGTWVLLGCGFGLIALLQWRKKKGQAA